jgi:hypothetical protein
MPQYLQRWTLSGKNSGTSNQSRGKRCSQAVDDLRGLLNFRLHLADWCIASWRKSEDTNVPELFAVSWLAAQLVRQLVASGL